MVSHRTCTNIMITTFLQAAGARVTCLLMVHRLLSWRSQYSPLIRLLFQTNTFSRRIISNKISHNMPIGF